MNLKARLAKLEREVLARQGQDTEDIRWKLVEFGVMARLTMIPPNPEDPEDTIEARWWELFRERGLEDDGTSRERIAEIEEWYEAGCTYRKQ